MTTTRRVRRASGSVLATVALTLAGLSWSAQPASATEVTSGGPTMSSCPHVGWCTHNSGWFHSPSSGTHAHCRDRGKALDSEGAVLRWTCDGNHLYYVPVEDD